MKRLLIAVILVQSLVGAPARYPQNWPVTTLFPEEPKLEVSKNTGYDYAGIASLDYLNQNFAVMRFVFPSGTDFTDATGEAIVKRTFLTNENRSLERADNIKIGGLPARRFVIADTAKNRVMDVRILFVRNEQYCFYCERAFATEPTRESEKFFDSIEIAPDLIALSPDPGPTAESTSAEKTAKILELFRITGMAKLIDQIVTQATTEAKAANPTLPGSYWEKVSAKMSGANLIEKIIPLYSKYFTDDDLTAIIAFYHTPTGQKMIAVTPSLMRESMAIGRDWGKKAAAQAIADQMSADDRTQAK